MKKALIVYGGWEGHQPKEIAEVFDEMLSRSGFQTEVSNTLESFNNLDDLMSLDLIVPVWTMGEAEDKQIQNVCAAVASGVGLAGCHGMTYAFLKNDDWKFLVGGQFASHPGNNDTEYVVRIQKGTSPLVDGVEDFTVVTEQYYLHVDPANEVLATTRFPVAPGPHTVNNPVDMPVIWTRRWGRGRVYYCSLGHTAEIVEMEPIYTLLYRGFMWASERSK